MLLGLTILLVLLAWTLGNTISRSTNSSTLDARTGRSLHSQFVLRVARYLRSKLPTKRSYALELLRRIELQTVLATPSLQNDVAARTVAKTGPFSECCALLIGRTSVGVRHHRRITARDSYESDRRLQIRTCGYCG